MDVRRKCTGGSECVISDEFIESIMELEKSVALNIGTLLDKTLHQVDENMMVPQLWGGVVDNNGSDFYFCVEIWSQDDGEHTAIMDLKEITLDDYLDLINSNKYLNERMDICDQYS